MYEDWHNIRSMWVNGEQVEAKNTLYQHSKTKIFKVIAQAIAEHRKTEINSVSGALTDLREIVFSIAMRKE